MCPLQEMVVDGVTLQWPVHWYWLVSFTVYSQLLTILKLFEVLDVWCCNDMILITVHGTPRSRVRAM